ncbi:T9SS type A sorting domain-containing protein [Flavisolibacter sp. BT320]|nr:T9SS type A sorting domain-containing protein [Flavisolibacter longurius]
MKRLLLLVITVFCAVAIQAQLLTWSPSFPTENSPLEITVDATKGNQGLLNHTPTSDVYVHTGVVTNLSGGAWRYVKFNANFNQPNAPLQATYLGNNKWKFTITGNLRDYYGVPAGETIQKIAILFRNGSGTKKQANIDGSDMYIPVYAATEFAVRLTQPATQPKLVPVPEPQTWAIGSPVTVSADGSKASALKLYHNGAVIATSNGNASTLSGTTTITVAGNQQIVAETIEGSTTAYDTINVFVAGATPVAPLPAGVKDGINYLAGNTSVTLVLRAPGKTTASVIGDFNNWSQTTASVMNRTPDGKFFWLTLTGLTAGTEYAYQYLVDGSIRIPDPYAEKILDPFNDQYIPAATYPGMKAYPAGKTTGMVGVLQTAQPAYNWSVNTFNRPDKKGLVIYELLLRDFLAAHDWKTLKDTLSYLKRLGVNAIELMPFNEFEGNISWGYNGFQYFAPDKYYGPKNNLKEFIDACHQNGIAVIMDIVLNHTYGPSPLKDLYGLANNPWYNPTAPHAAINFGDDFNHESADTKDFFTRVLQHWLTEYKIDGYRVDFSKGLTQKVTTSDGQMSATDASRIAILKNYYNVAQAASPNAYFILEHFADNTEEKELADAGMLLWSNVWTKYQEASMGYLGNSNFQEVIHSVRTWSQPHLVGFMESHDEERITYKNIRYGNGNANYSVRDTATALKRMALNAAFLLTIPGPKMIWQFGELGYDYSRCYLATNGEDGNCNTKTDPKPIPWNYQAEARRRLVFDTYSQLNKLRFHPGYTGAFQSGTVTQSLNGAFKWIKVTTANDTADLVVIGNFDVVAQTGEVTFPVAGTWYDYFGNFIHTATGGAQSFTLQPGEFHVYVNRNVNNVTATPVGNVPWNGTRFMAGLFPNPVQAGFTLDLALPQSGNLSVVLYNSMGQAVRTLYNGFLLKGERQLPLTRPAVPAGAYFLRLQLKAEMQTIPLTLQ